jgi:hypothetical protein
MPHPRRPRWGAHIGVWKDRRAVARPRKEPPEIRRERLNLRFTAAERAQLADAAGAAGVGLSDYARRSVLSQAGQASGPKAVTLRRIDPAAVAALSRVGANLNQLARRANAGDLLQPGELPEALAALDRQLTRIEALVLPEIDP